MKALAEENIRLAEPSLVAHITDYSQKKREVRGQMIKGLHPPRVRDPLLQAPIFSEDINIFPSSALISANSVALSVDDKLVLPREAYRHLKAPTGPKRLHHDVGRESHLPKKQKTSHPQDRFRNQQGPSPPRHLHRIDQREANTQRENQSNKNNTPGVQSGPNRNANHFSKRNQVKPQPSKNKKSIKYSKNNQ